MGFKHWLLENRVEVGQEFDLTVPGKEPTKVRIIAIKDGKAYLWPNYRGEPPTNHLHGSIPMPLSSVSHFVNDLSGKVDIKKRSGDQAIDAVLDGKGQYLGKGDDGVTFRVGNEVVKVSTTVPFIPENPFHRSPLVAARMIRDEAKIAQAMARAGVPGILPYRLRYVASKSFLVHPWVEIPDKFTEDQLAEVRNAFKVMHDKGWVYNDFEVQVGTWNGQMYFYDLGKADKYHKYNAEQDMDALERLYRKSGSDNFAPVGKMLQHEWDMITNVDGGLVWMAEDSPAQAIKLRARVEKLYQYALRELPDKQAVKVAYRKIMKKVPEPSRRELDKEKYDQYDQGELF